MRSTRKAWLIAAAGSTAGLLGLGLIAMPAGAGTAPKLPDISAEKLTESVLTAKTPAMDGTIEVDNNLGLPQIPSAGGSQPLDIDSAHVYTDGKDGKRASIQKGNDEQTLVTDGTTAWSWNSADRSATKISVDELRDGKHAGQHAMNDPANAARKLVAEMRSSSTVRVDGTARVAERPAYELVLTPKPSERTLLREVRVAVDSATRLPLRFTLLANGTSEPALQLEFTEFNVAPQPAELFRFTPPAGAKVTEQQRPEHKPSRHAQQPQVVGSGWDSVFVMRGTGLGNAKPDSERTDPKALLDQVGKKVSGPFGNGWIIGTKVGNALITEDQRVAVGAVPEQVLIDALGKTK